MLVFLYNCHAHLSHILVNRPARLTLFMSAEVIRRDQFSLSCFEWLINITCRQDGQQKTPTCPTDRMDLNKEKVRQ